MLERSERLLKLISYGLGAILLLQFVRIALRANPLAHATIPAVPSLATTNVAGDGKSTKAATSPEPAKKGAPGTNTLSKGTNAAPSQPATSQGTNQSAAALKQTNSVPEQAATKSKGTNSPQETVPMTNSVAVTNSGKGSSNSVAQAKPAHDTNSVAAGPPGARGTNTANRPGLAAGGPGNPPGAVFPGQGPGRGPAPSLPPEVQARVDRIVDSEIFAPVFHPLPMALLGIAGNVAFLRAPNGQTGIVKENEDLGGIKLLRIGTNRVLVEEEGQKKELTIFSGLGGESLLPKKENP